MKIHLRRNILFLYTCGCSNSLRKEWLFNFWGKGRPWMMLNNCRTYLFDYNSLPLLLVSASGIWQKHEFLFFFFFFLFVYFKPQVSSYRWELTLPSKAGCAEWRVTPWHALNSMAGLWWLLLALWPASWLDFCTLLHNVLERARSFVCWLFSSVFLVLWSAFFELNSSNLEVSTIIVWMAIKSYSLRSLQMQWD